MLVAFLPDQVCAHWDEIKGYILIASPNEPGDSPDRMNNFLEGFASGQMKLWISYDNNKKFNGLVASHIAYDNLDGVKVLVIDAIYAINTIKGTWMSGIETLRKYAVSKDCKKIIGHTKSNIIMEFVRSAGGTADYVLCNIPM